MSAPLDLTTFTWALDRWLPCDRCGCVPALPANYRTPCRCTDAALRELGAYLAWQAEKRIAAGLVVRLIETTRRAA